MGIVTLEALTERQRECLRLVSQGYKEKEIARELGIHHETVRKHLKGAMQRLNTNSRFIAARALAEHESHTPSGGAPTRVMAEDHLFESQPTHAEDSRFEQFIVMEQKVPFERLSDHLDPERNKPDRNIGIERYLRKIVFITAIALLLSILIISLIPLSDSIQKIASDFSNKR